MQAAGSGARVARDTGETRLKARSAWRAATIVLRVWAARHGAACGACMRASALARRELCVQRLAARAPGTPCCAPAQRARLAAEPRCRIAWALRAERQ
jgi:hypothetical protein